MDKVKICKGWYPTLTNLLTSVWHFTLGNTLIREIILAIIFLIVLIAARRRYRVSAAKQGARLNRNRSAWARRSGVRNVIIWGLILVAAVAYDRVWLNLNPELTVSAAVARVTGHQAVQAPVKHTKAPVAKKNTHNHKAAVKTPADTSSSTYSYSAATDGRVNGQIATKIVRGYYTTHASQADHRVVSYKFVDDPSAHASAPLFRVEGYDKNHTALHEYWVYSTGKFNVHN
ncbi:hypothetical protein PQ472_07580 [Lacticaseibacillus pabuli]|uniref:Uncharacterized protein n=1 Tax=Lacticaseibacillus pabuli TaxID=3025672 RepID=A0ABY7WRL4_9LACO|nr:hypothetical protein [Lacticaseibacillus sp. KACC 23028]WDF81785.1 hypothetical protein PQ472_07580 [Lacticaseibacillus sp. KACC 23028]